MHLPDGHVSVLGLTCLGTALQWRLGDGWHGFVYQHLLVLHSLTWPTQEMYMSHKRAYQQENKLYTASRSDLHTETSVWKLEMGLC